MPILVNPLVYLSGEFRGGLLGDTLHMSLTVVYLALAPATGLFPRLGVRGF